MPISSDVTPNNYNVLEAIGIKCIIYYNLFIPTNTAYSDLFWHNTIKDKRCYLISSIIFVGIFDSYPLLYFWFYITFFFFFKRQFVPVNLISDYVSVYQWLYSFKLWLNCSKTLLCFLYGIICMYIFYFHNLKT